VRHWDPEEDEEEKEGEEEGEEEELNVCE